MANVESCGKLQQSGESSVVRSCEEVQQSVGSIEKSLMQGKRDRERMFHSEQERFLPEKQNLHDYFGSEARRALQGECMSQRRLSEAKIEMDRKSWERRNSVMALNETNRQLESQQTRGLVKLKMESRSMFEELTMKSRLYEENHALGCMEIEELRRICREETERAQQLRTDALCAQKTFVLKKKNLLR